MYTLCEVCQLVVQFVEQELSNNASETQIEQDLENFCTTLPSGAASCKQILDQNLKTITKTALNTPSVQVCTVAHLCTDPLLVSHPEKTESDAYCPICEVIVQQVIDDLDNKIPESQVKEYMTQFCDSLPFVASECNTLVNQYLDTIFRYITSSNNSEVICVELALCSNSSLTRTFLSKRLSPKSSIACELCEVAGSAINGLLASNATQQEIVDDVIKLCSILPSELGSLCDQLVQQYAPQLIEMFEKEDPEQLCSAIDLCSGEFGLKKRFRTLTTK